MKIYTRKGDKGQTGLYGGSSTKKNSLVIKAVGELDELNSFLGLTSSYSLSDLKKILYSIQNDLFNTGAFLAGSSLNIDLKKKITWLERKIDKVDKELPTLKNFILPGGTLEASYLHVSRTVCRRVERAVSELLESEEKNQKEYENILIYLNRLSDLLFVMARYANFRAGEEEIKWSKDGKI